MKTIQRILLVLAFSLMGYSAGLHAEDTDIYVDNSTNDGVPNVLFVFDNGANFDAAVTGSGCSAYSGTTEPPSMGTNKAAGVLQCALVGAINSLPDSGVVNIGIMASNANGFASDVRSASDPGYHEVCSTAVGGCLLRKLTLMNAANKASLIAFIKSWKLTGANTAANFSIKVNTATPATTMQEAWAYYSGKVGMSGKDYATSLLETGCQKNFLVYVANTDKNPANESNPSPQTALAAPQVGATAAQLLPITGNVEFKPAAVCGSNLSAIADNWADEWTRLMFQKNGGAAGAGGKQNITTYTVGMDFPGCLAPTAALLSSMATVGGGQYFSTSNASAVATAFAAVLNEVQAVNSVFSSASLPVSVNAEGSYLNQIYLGMFRPDDTAAPRWMGNLKQYQLIKNVNGNLVLGDSKGNPAISSAGTGFISPNAISFWTSKDTSKVPDAPDSSTPPKAGFFKNDPKGVPLSGYDSPDGEVVEKGGVAQQMRLESLTASFGTTAGSSTNPRRLYTYCPTGSTCNAALTHASNQFSVANTGIGAAAFGESTTVRINSIVRTGTTALVTTSENHGFTTGAVVTISNATPNDYNVVQAVTVNSATTFTLTGLPDFPTSPSAGSYTVSTVFGSPVAINSITRTTSTTGGNNTEVATVTTSAAHNFTTASTIAISGATPSPYNYNGRPLLVPSATTFTFNIPISPPATATTGTSAYKVALSPGIYPPRSVSLSRSAANTIGGTTTSAHGFWVGQSIVISGATNYNGTYTIVSVPSVTSFTVTKSGLGNVAPASGTVVPDSTAITITGLSRAATTATSNATATVGTSNFLGKLSGATRVVNITATGVPAGEVAYIQSNVTITCANAGCTSFTYPIAVTPDVSAVGTMSASLAGSTLVVPAGGISRAGTIATVACSGTCPFTNGQVIGITANGAALASESAYTGSWTYSCATATCSSFTLTPVMISPATPAVGSNMQAYSGSTPPDKDTIIKWVRGDDNFGGEKGPGGTVTVRPSIHGDVLHSRPLVVNYGDSRGIVVFYGSNDGVYRAANGNQTAAMGTVPAGGELWGLVLPEHYSDLNRLRKNSPELQFPSTILASAQPKDYFVDGPTGAYQKLKADGTIDKAYIFLTMRRGGRFVYAIDVTTPTAPTLLWKLSAEVVGFEELGQTWSRPRVTLMQGGGLGTTPVLVFGAGYDAAEDSQPPTTGSAGRGVFVVNALTGALIWSASPTCVTSATCRNVPEMTYAIPSDIAFVDRDLNGGTDKLYFGDMGGNVWRADVSDASTANWTVTKLAALGCATGTCAAGTTPRKFFFPPAVLTVRPSGASGSFEAISLASGDREHPLKVTTAGSSYNVNDRFFMLVDRGTAIGTPITNNLTPANLFNATTAEYDGSLNGFYVNFTTGEKAVNAPLAVNGSVFFATNRPVDRSQACVPNLGEAKAYAVSPFLGTAITNILPGGGLAPSAVSGLITITTTKPDGTTSSSDEKFCIGCGISGSSSGAGTGTCNSALENCTLLTTVPKNMKRTYWYRK